MDLTASLALHARGKDHWNEWAAAMIERRRGLVSSGQWSWARDSRADVYATNTATGTWQQEAAAQFSYHAFEDAPDFTGFVFPGAAVFVASKLPRGARFRDAQFRDGACFNFARFGDTAEFENATFVSDGQFDSTIFGGDALFDGARFEGGEFQPTSDGRLDCTDATFEQRASFARVRCVDAVFANTKFAQAVSFENASFSAMFFLDNTTFHGPVLIAGAQFADDVDWSDATVIGTAHK